MAILKDTAWIIIISQSRAGGGEDALIAVVLQLGLKIKVV